jgi:hypothetical protein
MYAMAHVLIIAMALATMAIVLMILGQAIGQFDGILKIVLRSPKDEPDPEPVRLRVLTPAAMAAAIVALSLFIAFLTR